MVSMAIMKGDNDFYILISLFFCVWFLLCFFFVGFCLGFGSGFFFCNLVLFLFVFWLTLFGVGEWVLSFIFVCLFSFCASFYLMF